MMRCSIATASSCGRWNELRPMIEPKPPGALYLLTGEERYAGHARELLLAYADMYPSLGEHPVECASLVFPARAVAADAERHVASARLYANHPQQAAKIRIGMRNLS